MLTKELFGRIDLHSASQCAAQPSELATKTNFMMTSQSVPSVWPGYVAAIASLVLSLLLLLAILVFALTQVGNLVSSFMQEILRATLISEQSKNSSRVNSTQRVQPVRPHIQDALQANEVVAPGTPLKQLRLIFGADLADIPAAQLNEVNASIKQIQAPDDAAWKIWASVLTGDAVMERTTYRLLLAVRKNLIAQGVSEKQIELQLKPSKTPPPYYQKGEIIIYVAPLHLRATERGQP